jgi:hypothetical protein
MSQNNQKNSSEVQSLNHLLVFIQVSQGHEAFLYTMTYFGQV